MAVESYLDTFFSARGWAIQKTTPHQERVLCLGDRVFTKGKERLNIEYKSGIQTGSTGNIFLETVSVDTFNKPGWAFTCQADCLFYACLLNKKILVFIPARLREQMPALRVTFKEVATKGGQNKGYNTHGLIVPLAYAERELADKVIPT